MVDFDKLNEKAIGDSFHPHRIKDIHVHVFLHTSGYHQILVHPKDRAMTGFSTDYGDYQLKGIPFGLKGAPATLQRLMKYVITGLQSVEYFIYLDDIVNYGKILKDHIQKLRTVFDRERKWLEITVWEM